MTEGWYVKDILTRTDEIRSKIVTYRELELGGLDFEALDSEFYTSRSSDGFDVDTSPIESIDFDDDEYTDLLTIEIKAKELYEAGAFSDREVVVLELLLGGESIYIIEKTLKISRATLVDTINRMSEKIAFALGDYFTNEGMLSNMEIKHGLTEDQLNRLRIIMER